MIAVTLTKEQVDLVVDMIRDDLTEIDNASPVDEREQQSLLEAQSKLEDLLGLFWGVVEEVG